MNKSGKGDLNGSPQIENGEGPKSIFGTSVRSRKEERATKVAKEYFEIETSLVILKQARATHQDNEFLEFLIKFSARKAADLYVRFRKLTGHGPVPADSGSVA